MSEQLPSSESEVQDLKQVIADYPESHNGAAKLQDSEKKQNMLDAMLLMH